MNEKIEDQINRIIILLGAQNNKQGQLSEMALSRSHGVFQEWQRQPGSKILITGGYGTFNVTKKPHWYYLARYLIKLGVEIQEIFGAVYSRSTVEDAALSSKLLYNYAPKSITVVTSEHHLERVRLIFEHFFAAEVLTFSGTPNLEPPERLRELCEHELRQIEIIKRQGGIIFDGKLIIRKSVVDNLQSPDSP